MYYYYDKEKKDYLNATGLLFEFNKFSGLILVREDSKLTININTNRISPKEVTLDYIL